MTRDEIASATTVDYSQAEAAIVSQPPGTRIEFFGGEPTLHPRFLDFVRLAREHGHSCSMATNGRRLSDEDFVSRLAELGAEEIYVRTSVYGDCAAVHDQYTGVQGSYAETWAGILHCLRRGFLVQVNTVILEKNVERLTAIARRVHQFEVPRIKFGNLVDVELCAPHAVPLSRVSEPLNRAIEVSEDLGLVVTVEKTPICVIAGRIDLVSTERQLGHWPRGFDDQGVCGDCLVRSWCDGLDPGYVSVFGYDGIHRLEKVPAKAVEGDPERPPEFLKMHCVRVPNPKLDEATATKLHRVLTAVENQHGRLAVFPNRTIDGS
jgi:pyruvate-formate lyase-activating enzyme